MSLDYGHDSPLSVDQISFNSFKERVAPGEESLEVKIIEEPVIGIHQPLSYEEAVGKATNSVSIISVPSW